MSTWAIYDEKTGRIVSHFTGPQSQLAANLPAGHAAKDGRFDPLCQRVNTESGEIEDYQPPQPDADHEWHAESKRWVLSEAASARRMRIQHARARITQLENSQHRAIRETALGDPDAAARLKAIDQEIAQLRADLSA